MCHIPFLPLQRLTASYGSELTEAVQRVVQSGYYLNGEALAEFEQRFAHYVQAPHCVGVASGLDALMLSLMAMKQCYDWSDGDEVIVPDMTFVATALAVVRAGLVPVSADVDDNGLLTPEAAQRVLSARTRAVVPVHLYGHPAPMPAFMAWAEAHGLLVLEDAAQAHGASVGGRPVGSWGHMAAFSFYPGKNLGALGDGGAVTTAHSQLAEHVRMLANYGARQKYHHEYPGINSRLDEVQAAVLSVKLWLRGMRRASTVACTVYPTAATSRRVSFTSIPCARRSAMPCSATWPSTASTRSSTIPARCGSSRRSVPVFAHPSPASRRSVGQSTN